MQNFQNVNLAAILINRLMVTRPQMNAEATPTKDTRLISTLSVIPRPTSATRTTGMLIRKLSLSAWIGLYPRKSKVETVRPDLLSPGKTEKA
jgi:hypothetical protein